MKLLHIAHVAFTMVLTIVVVGLGIMSLTGVIEMRWRVGDTNPQRGQPPQADGVKARLLVIRGLQPNWEYSIHEGKNFIGRADQKPVDIDLQPQEPVNHVWSSRQHALITHDGRSMVIEDLSSTNGTYVNRTRVPPGEKRPLVLGNVIQIGEVQMKVF